MLAWSKSQIHPERHYVAQRLTFLTDALKISRPSIWGEPVPETWQTELTRLAGIPLDESPGEKWHRASNYTNRRSPHVRLPWILGSVRHQKSLKKLHAYLKRFGVRGARVLNFEWRNFKRVIQVGANNSLRNKRISLQTFYKRLYRMDEWGRLVWGSLVALRHFPYEAHSTDA